MKIRERPINPTKSHGVQQKKNFKQPSKESVRDPNLHWNYFKQVLEPSNKQPKNTTEVF